MIKAIIIDDELSAIESLTWEIENYCTEVKVIEHFTNPTEAISAINYLKPDLVFLDIQMPELDGFHLLKKLDYRGFDLIITTAYNQYALQAFKVDAIDYLLKPIDTSDLLRALSKVKKHLDNNLLGNNLEKILASVTSKELHHSKRIPLALIDKVIMIKVENIVYCKSDGNYTYVILESGKSHFLSKSIKSVTKLISTKCFLRVHKSYLININYVQEYIRGDGGELILTNGQNIPVSRMHKQELLEALKIK